MNAAAPSGGRETPPMPAGIRNVYLYEIFNTFSWSAMLSTPMFLFLQHLQATATILAIMASLSPMLTILQIPAARFVEQVGYRRFVLGGWTSRSICVGVVAVIALLPEQVDRTTRIAAVLFFLFLYNTLRGISICGLLPWFTHIVPAARRGEFLAKDQLAGSCSSIFSLFFNSWLLSHHSGGVTFGIVFGLSTVGAFLSLFFLRRVPDVPVEQIQSPPGPVPWRSMIFYPPFLRYVRYVVVINMANGVSAAFWVRYLHTFLHLSSSATLLVAALTTTVSALTLFSISPLIDRAGNKPVLTLSGLLLVCHFACWGAVAAGVIPFNWLVIGWQVATSGLSGALWNLANVRAVMAIVPEMGRAHFLALYSVASSMALGIMPLVWGPVLDALNGWDWALGWWHWNAYSLLYLVLALTIVAGLLVLRTLPETKTMTWDELMAELLVKTPSRAITRLLSRLRAPWV